MCPNTILQMPTPLNIDLANYQNPEILIWQRESLPLCTIQKIDAAEAPLPPLLLRSLIIVVMYGISKNYILFSDPWRLGMYLTQLYICGFYDETITLPSH